MSYDTDATRLVEEVPGVPEYERWYLWHNHKVEEQFSTLRAAQIHCNLRGIVVDHVERFEP